MPRLVRGDVIDGDLPIFEVRVLEQSRQFAVIAGVDFAMYQQRQALRNSTPPS